MTDILRAAAEAAGSISAIAAAAVLIVKPAREWLFGLDKLREGQKCLLRSQMLLIYYRHREEKQIRQYEYENFMLMYAAYKALIGNSFIDKVKDELGTWEVTP